MSLTMAQTGIVCWLLAGVARCSGFFLTPLTEHRWGRHRNGELLATLRVERGEDKTFGIDYNWIDRPASALPPLVVLHGGPSVPSNYLRPLEDVVTDRSILFYDQLGCGKSDEPKETSFYSIPLAVNDLIQLLQEVGVSEQGFHLYGQSFGGILAFEYLKRRDKTTENCLSVVLSSTPTDVKQMEKGVEVMLSDLNVSEAEMAEAFRLTHQCRTPEMPPCLADAYANAGTVWRGTGVIADYKASLPEPLTAPPALVVRGQHDFVTYASIEEWKSCFATTQMVELRDCAHHGLLERPDAYADVLQSFWKDHE